MTYAVVGCSECPELWIVNTRKNSTQTKCTRCGRVYDRQQREWLASAKTRPAAAKKRGELLRERADA